MTKAETFGLSRMVEVGIRVAPTAASAKLAAHDIWELLQSAPGPVRIAGIGNTGTRVSIVIGVTLGSVEDIKSSADQTQEVVRFISQFTEKLGHYDPAFSAIPDTHSIDARIADHVLSQAEAYSLGFDAKTYELSFTQAVAALALQV